MIDKIREWIGIVVLVCLIWAFIFGIKQCSNAMVEHKNNMLEEIKRAPNEKIIIVSIFQGDPLRAANNLDRFYKAVSARYLSSESAALEGKWVFYEVTMVKKEEYK